MMELHRHGLLAEVPSPEDLIKIIPTNTRDIRSTCQTYNDYLFAQSAQRSLDAAICITDAGKTTSPSLFLAQPLTTILLYNRCRGRRE